MSVSDRNSPRNEPARWPVGRQITLLLLIAAGFLLLHVLAGTLLLPAGNGPPPQERARASFTD